MIFKMFSLRNQPLLKSLRRAVVVGKRARKYRAVCTHRAPRGSREGAAVCCGTGGYLPTYVLIPLPPIRKERRGLLRTKKSSKTTLVAAKGSSKPGTRCNLTLVCGRSERLLCTPTLKHNCWVFRHLQPSHR